jgi:hypothetical protein
MCITKLQINWGNANTVSGESVDSFQKLKLSHNTILRFLVRTGAYPETELKSGSYLLRVDINTAKAHILQLNKYCWILK